MISLVYDIGKKLTSIRRVPYECLDERKRYLESLNEPRSWLERSYLQYLCQYHEHLVVRVLLNFVCIPIAVVILIRVISDAILNRGQCEPSGEVNKSIAIFDAEAEIIPQAIIENYGKPIIYSLKGSILFDKDALEICAAAARDHWFEPHFLVKVFLRLGRYSKLISMTKCEVIIASAEYSFASSVLTGLCEKKSIVHVNVMHGEKIINLVDAFCGFHEFYVWDPHYILIFSALRAKVERYLVAKPAMLVAEESRGGRGIKHDFTYYLGWELSQADTVSIKKSMGMLVKDGKTVCIRMHPRYGDRAKIEALFRGFEIEHPDVVTVAESIGATRAIVALWTSVFWQAEALGCQIVIDDVSNSDFYKKLTDLRYLWVSRPHTRLSQLNPNFVGASRDSPT